MFFYCKLRESRRDCHDKLHVYYFCLFRIKMKQNNWCLRFLLQIFCPKQIEIMFCMFEVQVLKQQSCDFVNSVVCLRGLQLAPAAKESDVSFRHPKSWGRGSPGVGTRVRVPICNLSFNFKVSICNFPGITFQNMNSLLRHWQLLKLRLAQWHPSLCSVAFPQTSCPFSMAL